MLKSRTIHQLILSDRDAMTAWEYGLIACLITVAIIAATTSLGITTTGAFASLSSKLNAAAGR